VLLDYKAFGAAVDYDRASFAEVNLKGFCLDFCLHFRCLKVEISNILYCYLEGLRNYLLSSACLAQKISNYSDKHNNIRGKLVIKFLENEISRTLV